MKSKQWFRNSPRWLVPLLLGCGLARLDAQEFELSKSLFGATGQINAASGPYAVNFAWGETFSGHVLNVSSISVESGYYSGRFGVGQTFRIESFQVGGKPSYFQNGLQIGVTVQAPVEIIFSDQLEPTSLHQGIHATILQDNLSNPQNRSFEVVFTYTPGEHKLLVRPAAGWLGNTVYDIALEPSLRSINGYALDRETHIRFLTMADPHQQNVVTNTLRVDPLGKSVFSSAGMNALPSLDLSSEALSDYAVLLFNDRTSSPPDSIDPAVLADANQKARNAGGLYRTPLRLIELSAYNPAGKQLSVLTRSAHLSVAFESDQGWVQNAPTGVHASSVALWTLDQTHRIWVKIPDSRPGGQQVSAPVTRFSLYAVMGSAQGNARDVFVFPNPWRPFGPNAGDGSGQTGSEQGGIVFSNLPSECTIQIFSLSGGLVRSIAHSDAAGPLAQQVWDGFTAGGDHSASGVYLWRVQSSQDVKTGKLMVIR